jgi:hypothetical protein
MSTLTPEALRAEGMTIYPVGPGGDPVLPPTLDLELAQWEFETEAECLAALRVVNWAQANGGLFGCCTMPYRAGDRWLVWIGLGEDYERPEEDE